MAQTVSILKIMNYVNSTIHIMNHYIIKIALKNEIEKKDLSTKRYLIFYSQCKILILNAILNFNCIWGIF